MKLTDLTYMYAPAWPPAWAGPYGSDGKLPEGDEGVLAGVHLRADGHGLVLDVTHEGHHYRGVLLWDGNPEVRAVADALGGVIGRPIRTLHALEIGVAAS